MMTTGISNTDPAIMTVMPYGISTVQLPYGMIPPLHVAVLLNRPDCEAVKLNELTTP